MMEEMLDFFLGAIHLYVTDPELIPLVDAVCAPICVTICLVTACVISVQLIKFGCSLFNRR